MSLELQRAFGLRREEEAIKLRPHYANRRDHLLLKASWTKGGQARMHGLRHTYAQERYTALCESSSGISRIRHQKRSLGA